MNEKVFQQREICFIELLHVLQSSMTDLESASR